MLIEGERVADVVLCPTDQSVSYLIEEYQDWNALNFEELCVSPGIIDFNIRRDYEDLTQMTRVALIGGVTMLVDEVKNLSSDLSTQLLYCDVGQVALVSKPGDVTKAFQKDVLGYKAYLCQPSEGVPFVEDIAGILEEASPTGLPLLIDALLPDLRLYHLASPCHFLPAKHRISFHEPNTGQLFASAYAGEADSSDVEDEEVVTRVLRVQSTCDPSRQHSSSRPADFDAHDIRSRSRKMTDNFLTKEPQENSAFDLYTDLAARIRANEQDIEYLSHLEQQTYSYSGTPAQPTHIAPPLTATGARFNRLRPTPITVEKQYEDSDKEVLYMNYLANFPDHWETLGVKKVIQACAGLELKVHFCNLSAASAVNAILKRKGTNITCDTSAPYLGLTDADILKGDTRLKASPPIRNKRNCNLLWELLKVKAIDMITSHHCAVPPALKFLKEGSFKLAVCGISGLGYALQQVWTKIRIPCASKADMEHYLIRLSKWMSLYPAKLLGVSESRGSIARGKVADLIVWDPYSRAIASGSNGQYPEVFPYTGQLMYGVIHKVIVKGQIAYESGMARPLGKIVGRDR